MKNSLLILLGLLTVQTETVFAKCDSVMLQAADYKNMTFPIPGHKSPVSYYYLVKKDLRGDGSKVEMIPIVSKEWNLSDDKLEEIAKLDKNNPEGSKISLIRGPKNKEDHNSLGDIGYDLDHPEAYCERADKFRNAINTMKNDIGVPPQQSASSQ